MPKQFYKASDKTPGHDPLKDNLTALALAVTKEALLPGADLGVRLEALKVAGAYYTSMKRVAEPPEKDGGAFDAYRKSLADAEGSEPGRDAGADASAGADTKPAETPVGLFDELGEPELDSGGGRANVVKLGRGKSRRDDSPDPVDHCNSDENLQ